MAANSATGKSIWIEGKMWVEVYKNVNNGKWYVQWIFNNIGGLFGPYEKETAINTARLFKKLNNLNDKSWRPPKRLGGIKNGKNE